MMSTSLSAKAQEVTITLIPGWTQISYPSADTIDFATAFGDFVPMQGDLIRSQWGQATYTNGRWRGSTSQFYPGYGYQYKSNRQMPVMVTFNAQQSSSQVVVSTSEPMLITAISAMGGGEVTSNDGTYIITKGLCWAAHENPTTNDDFYQEAESGVGSFSISMTGLNIATTYYVRAYAVTPNGTVYGNQKVFITRDGIPEVTTDSVTNILGDGAICGGIVTDDVGLNVIVRGICWSTSPNPTLNDSHTTNGNGMGSFSSSIIGLSVSTTYYVRAYATTTAGTGYGQQMTFTTRNGVPEVVTSSITDNYSDFATCGGIVVDDGGLPVISRGICWSTASNPTINGCHTVNGSGLGSFTGNMIGLSFNTIYYVRSYASTSQATVYGNEVVFTSSTQTWTNGILPGVFSVSPNQQVRFSQGNLQYKASTNTWRFASNQWDWVGGNCDIDPHFTCCEECDKSYGGRGYIGNVYEDGMKSNNDEISVDYSGWIDLFGWGTSGWHESNDPYNVRYQPWSTNTSTINTSYNNYGYGPSTNMPSTDLTGSSANYDWGVYNSISNGGNQPNQWRTLTNDEWNYVFNTRATISGIRWVAGEVNNVTGIILLPDNWDPSIYELYPEQTHVCIVDENCNDISASEWLNIFEPNGAVFFPITGYRSGTTYHFQESPDECYNDDCSYYWSISHKSNKYAYCVRFTSGGLEGINIYLDNSPYRSRFRGLSVRLVCPIE